VKVGVRWSNWDESKEAVVLPERANDSESDHRALRLKWLAYTRRWKSSDDTGSRLNTIILACDIQTDGRFCGRYDALLLAYTDSKSIYGVQWLHTN